MGFALLAPSHVHCRATQLNVAALTVNADLTIYFFTVTLFTTVGNASEQIFTCYCSRNIRSNLR